MNGTDPNTVADIPAPAASQAGRWQFSLLQLVGVTTGLAMALGAAVALLRPSSAASAALYALLAAVGSGVVVGSGIRRPLHAIVGAISAAIPAIGLFYPYTTTDYALRPGEWHVGLLIAVFLLIPPGSAAAMRPAVRAMHAWAIFCAATALAIYVVSNGATPWMGVRSGLPTAVWWLGLLVLGAVSYSCAIGVGVLGWAWGRFGLALLDLVCTFCLRRVRSKSRTDG